MVAEEVELLEVLEAEAGTAGGVDLDGTGDAKRVRIVAGGAGRLRGLLRRRRIDEALMKDVKLPTVSQRPVSSVVTTVSE